MKLESNLRDFILVNYNQVALMAYWFRVEEDDINYCLENTSNKISNPLRIDNTPSLGFMWRANKLNIRDWGDSTFNGDIFHVVGLCNNLNSNDNFVKICKIIIVTNERGLIRDKANKNNIIRGLKNITFENKPFTYNELEWWNKGGILTNHLTLRYTYSANTLYIDDDVVYDYNPNDPCYVYNLGDKLIKAYRPLIKNKMYKFITNIRNIFEAPHELYSARVLIITKSRKDKFVLECNLENDNNTNTINSVLQQLGSSFNYIGDTSNSQDIHDYCITSFLNESQRITQSLAKYLQKTYDIVIINVDFDKEGIYNAFYHSFSYGFYPVFIGAKSINNEIFNSKYTKGLFKSILDNVTITLHNGILLEFVNTHMNDIEDKDCFEYFTNNGIDKGKELINNKFNISNFEI